MVEKYEDFVYRVEELGYMAFSDFLPGFPSLVKETPDKIWHTGSPETDPWCWKDRAAGEKKLAFGCILGGHKGFVASRMYPLFFAAYRPSEHMEERMEGGQMERAVYELWRLFEKKTMISTAEIRREMGVTKKKGGSKVDRAVRELQKYYYITVAGSRRRINLQGLPYGWPANVYDKVENWVPNEWLDLASTADYRESGERILDRGMAISDGINRLELIKALDLQHIFGSF